MVQWCWCLLLQQHWCPSVLKNWLPACLLQWWLRGCWYCSVLLAAAAALLVVGVVVPPVAPAKVLSVLLVFGGNAIIQVCVKK
jgi:hypothetical protein